MNKINSLGLEKLSSYALKDLNQLEELLLFLGYKNYI